MKKMLEYALVGNTQIVVTGPKWSELTTLREVAADHGFEVVDARFRRSDRVLMILSFVLFLISGGWPLLLVSLWAGRDWALSFPRRDR